MSEFTFLLDFTHGAYWSYNAVALCDGSNTCLETSCVLHSTDYQGSLCALSKTHGLRNILCCVVTSMS